MRFPYLAAAAFAGGALLLILGQSATARPAPLDAAVLREVNFARTHPADYARELRRAADARGPVGFAQAAYGDEGALDEAIAFLERQRPMPPLGASQGLAAAARAHASAQGRTWDVGHVSPDGETLSERLHAHGVWAGLAAEDISYGYGDARNVVRQLIVDAGVPDRGHREAIFGRYYKVAGVACAGHRQWGAMCVIDFAGALVRR